MVLASAKNRGDRCRIFEKAPHARWKEAGAGIEPANSGFADRDLTTWLPRRVARTHNIVVAALVSSAEHGQAFASTTASAFGQRFNASANPVIVSA